MTESILKLENVTMQFGGVTALNDVSFEIKKQEILGLIGPNDESSSRWLAASKEARESSS